MARADHPPSPDGLPLLGHGLQFSQDPFGAVRRWAGEGDVVRLAFPTQTLYMVTEPTLVEQVLVEDFDSYTLGRPQRETFDGVEDDAISGTAGEQWSRLRRALHPAFTWEGIQQYGPRMAERAAAHVEGWETGQELDLLAEMRTLTLHVLGETLLGVDIAGDEAVVHEAADALVDRADPRRPGQLLPDWVPTPTERRFRRRVAALDDYIEGVLAESSPGEGDVCSVMLAAHEAGDLSMPEVRDNLTALLLAGHDSAAVAMTYAWLELSRNPDVADSVRTEVDAVVDGDNPTTDDFEALTTTQNVVRETLRLYPPVWSVNREVAEPVTLGGYDLDPGTQLLMPQWVLHRDERYWTDPDSFDPSRWDDEAAEADRPAYAYFPFSGGPRHCIGMRFARLELAMVLATMVARVDLDVQVDGELTFTPSLSLRPETEITATVGQP